LFLLLLVQLLPFLLTLFQSYLLKLLEVVEVAYALLSRVVVVEAHGLYQMPLLDLYLMALLMFQLVLEALLELLVVMVEIPGLTQLQMLPLHLLRKVF
jgi:hypothetical protein